MPWNKSKRFTYRLFPYSKQDFASTNILNRSRSGPNSVRSLRGKRRRKVHLEFLEVVTIGRHDFEDYVWKEETMNEIPNYWPGRCFGCSQTNEHGLKLRFWKTEKGCYTRCAVPDHLCGIEGVVHGGILTLILEEVAQWTIISHFAKFGMTREISVRYLKPVPTNLEILVEAQITSKTDKDISFSSRITGPNGKLLTEGVSSWIFATPSAIAGATSVAESTLQQFLARYSKDLS